MANAAPNRRGTGHEESSAGVGAALAAEGFAFEFSNGVDSATTVSSTSASAAARTLRQAIGLRLSGTFRRDVARRRERANTRSISERVHQSAKGQDRTPVPASQTAARTG